MPDKKTPPLNEPSVLPIRIRATQETTDLLPDDLAYEFRDEIKQVLLIFGDLTAIVYDTTCVCDLGLSMEKLAEARIKLGVAVSEHDFVVNIARQVRELNRTVEQQDGYLVPER